MSGRLIGIVGPSGVGKDCVMQALAQKDERFGLVERVVTREPDVTGEACLFVTEREFMNMHSSGEFALHWQAHGLRYGIRNKIKSDLKAGHDLLVNLSRSVLLEAQRFFDDFTVVNLDAPKEVLSERLIARGRENPAAIADRLERADFALPQGLMHVLHVNNSGPLEETVARLLTLLQPESARR